MRSTDRLNACFGHPEMLHLPFGDQVSDRTCHILNRYVLIDSVLIEQIDTVGTQPLQRSLHHGANALGATVLSFV
ncbi:hypothetical protein D3C86_2026750 [compost metagenome]